MMSFRHNSLSDAGLPATVVLCPALFGTIGSSVPAQAGVREAMVPRAAAALPAAACRGFEQGKN